MKRVLRVHQAADDDTEQSNPKQSSADSGFAAGIASSGVVVSWTADWRPGLELSQF